MVQGHTHLHPGCPVRAGIGPGATINAIVIVRLPRASGDRPYDLWLDVGMGLVAPCERG